MKKIYKLSRISQTHTFHALRHTFCSLMINKDINVRAISEILGHSSVTITFDIYSTLFDEVKAKTMDAIDDIWNMAI